MSVSLRLRWNGIWPLGMWSCWESVPWLVQESLRLLVPRHRLWLVLPWLFQSWFQPCVLGCQRFSLLSLPHVTHQPVVSTVISMLSGGSILPGWVAGWPWLSLWMPYPVLPLVGVPISRGYLLALVLSCLKLSVDLSIPVKVLTLIFCQSWSWSWWRLFFSWIPSRPFVWTPSW